MEQQVNQSWEFLFVCLLHWPSDSEHPEEDRLIVIIYNIIYEPFINSLSTGLSQSLVRVLRARDFSEKLHYCIGGVAMQAGASAWEDRMGVAVASQKQEDPKRSRSGNILRGIAGFPSNTPCTKINVVNRRDTSNGQLSLS